MIYKAFTCSFDLYNISNFIINQTFSIINKSFFKLKKHAALCGCYGCHTRTRSRLFWSLVIFTLLYSPWQPYNLCWKRKDFFSLKILLRKPRFIKSKRKSDRLTWWVFKCCCHKIICSRLCFYRHWQCLPCFIRNEILIKFVGGKTMFLY